ncbi:protein Flattop homolog [Scaptodrosophila lebanonensis]|uniref:Cilia- and flagella-associated protein 126 n=1 Tax=Drosophila lebanonensis TaxID=7225 RepID=A0A6J2TT88_DROLE|nr:protein Flattop homolog [Scaptodrosophila lebanonensis]
MSYHFSALQFEDRFRPKGLRNWEFPRTYPPRPRDRRPNVTFIADNNGRLLPHARRDKNPFGFYRTTYELPLRITHSFVKFYDVCLSGRYKFRHFPRDLCHCENKKRLHPCDQHDTVGVKEDPYWATPKGCQTKCEGLKKLVAAQKRSCRCYHRKCDAPTPRDSVSEERISLPPNTVIEVIDEKDIERKRPITAFNYRRKPRHN